MWPQPLKEDCYSPREPHSQCCRPNRSHCPASNQPNYYWRDYVDGEIPCDALQGPEGKLIGQVNYEDCILPAHFCPTNRLAIAERFGKRTIDKNIKILCTPYPGTFSWEPIEFNNVTDEQMQNVVKGGSQDDYDLFIGTAFHDDEWKIGKVVPKTNSYKGLQVWDKVDYYWRDYFDGEIPCDALQGPEAKLIGQVSYGGQILPAHFCPINRLAIAERAGKQTIDRNIKIFCTPYPNTFSWEPIEFNIVTEEQMRNAVKGGSQDDYDLFIGTAFHDDEWKIGKVVPKTNPFQGLQVWDEDDYYWRDYVNGQIPCDALQGPEGKFIGQVNYNGQVLPAHLCPIKRIAIVESAKKRTIIENIKIFCTPNPDTFSWEPIEFSSVTDEQMQNAIKGGFQDDYDLFIGAACHEGGWKIGKVVPKTNPNNGLHVWDKRGACTIIRSFRILKFLSDA